MLKIDNEFKNLIPPLSKEESEQLEKNILEFGLQDAICTWNGIIIDGHNRYEIACKHGINYKTSEWVFDNREQVMLWMIDTQLGRRNLPPFVRTELQLKKKNILLDTGKLIKQANLKNNDVDLTMLSNREKHNTRKEIAEKADVSEGTVHKVEKILQKAPEPILQKVKSGEISINQAYQQVRKQEKLEKVEEKISQAKQNSTGFINIYDTDKKYNIIYADPAWSYTEWDNGYKNPKTQYKTMSLDDIRNLPVKNITDDNCILFLWVTYPLLQDSFKVMESWGFKYKTAGFVWVKKNKSGEGNFFGCGNWTRANSELCLIGIKGNITRLDASISQVIETPIEEHSKKPDMVRDLITKLVGELPRIELFSRKEVDGWDIWGNEI